MAAGLLLIGLLVAGDDASKPPPRRSAPDAEAVAPSSQRPATLPAGHLTVQGQVRLPRRIREVAIDESGRVFESVLVGPGVWERSAATVDALPAVSPDLTTRGGRVDQGAALVPE